MIAIGSAIPLRRAVRCLILVPENIAAAAAAAAAAGAAETAAVSPSVGF